MTILTLSIILLSLFVVLYAVYHVYQEFSSEYEQVVENIQGMDRWENVPEYSNRIRNRLDRRQ